MLITFQGSAGNCGDYEAQFNGCYLSSYYMGRSDWIQYQVGVNGPADTGGTLTTLVSVAVTSVPEPATFVLFMMGLAFVIIETGRTARARVTAAMPQALRR